MEAERKFLTSFLIPLFTDIPFKVSDEGNQSVSYGTMNTSTSTLKKNG